MKLAAAAGRASLWAEGRRERGGAGWGVGGHKWKQNVLELKSQWLEDQEASRRASGDPGPAGPLSFCGASCSHSTCLSSRGAAEGIRPAPGQPGAGGGENCGVEADIRARGRSHARHSPLKSPPPFFLLIPVSIFPNVSLIYNSGSDT